MSIESLQEEKRYLLSELSLEKEQHQAALEQLAALQRTHSTLLEQFAETEAQLQETQVALLNKDKRVHALQRQTASAADANVVDSLTKENESLRAQIASSQAQVTTLQALVQSNRTNNNNNNNNNDIDASLGHSVGPEGVADLRRELAESQIHANRVQKQFDIFKSRAADDAKRNQQRIVALEGDVKRKASALEILQQSVESYGQQQQPPAPAAAAASSSAAVSQAAIDAEVAPLRAELAKVRAALEHANGERDSVHLELQAAIDELNRARTNVHRDAALEQQLARTRVDSGELQRLRVQCEQLEALLGMRDNELAAARDEAGLLAQLRAKYDAVFGELTAAKSALASAQVRLDHQQQQLREQQQSQQQLLRASASGEAGASSTTSELRSELATAREQLSEARAAEREASAQCAALRQQVEAHQASLQRLASQSERERKAIRLAHIRATKLQIDELKTIVQTQLLFENRLVSVL